MAKKGKSLVNIIVEISVTHSLSSSHINLREERHAELDGSIVDATDQTLKAIEAAFAAIEGRLNDG